MKYSRIGSKKQYLTHSSPRRKESAEGYKTSDSKGNNFTKNKTALTEGQSDVRIRTS